MKMLYKRILTVLTLLSVSIVSGVVSPASAASIILANGFIHDAKGKPIPGILVLVSSTNPSNGATLNVFKVSDSKGRFQAQSFANYSVTVNDTASCLVRFPGISGTVSSENKTIDIVAPSERFVKFSVATSSGLPIADLQATVLERNYGNGWSCQSQPNARTNDAGQATIRIFEGGSTTRAENQAGVVYYQPFEDVQLTQFVSEADLADNSVSIVLDDVPSAEMSSPSIAKTSGFDIGATVREPDGSVSIAASSIGVANFGISAVRAQFSKVQLMKRSFVKGKWSSWSKQSVAPVGSNGKAKFAKIRLAKNKYQFRIVGVGYSIGSAVKTITVK